MEEGREVMKDKRYHYGAMDKPSVEQQVCGDMAMTSVVRKKTGAIFLSSTSGSYGRLAGFYTWFYNSKDTVMYSLLHMIGGIVSGLITILRSKSHTAVLHK